MIRFLVFGFLAATLSATAQAALVVTSEGGGQVSRQYFEDGVFVLMQADKPSMGVDRQGNCWFIERKRLVSDPCEKMLQSVKAIRDQAMAGLSTADRAMMERVMQVQRSAQPASMERSGNRKIAGYPVVCHLIGGRREICISDRLLNEIATEMGDSRFIELFQRFGESTTEMGGDTPETKAVADLAERGFPMSDMQKVAATPAMDPEILQHLPEARRALVIKQMEAAASGQMMRGTQVIRVEKNAAMPELDLSRYPRLGFQQFMQQSMGQMGRIPGTR